MNARTTTLMIVLALVLVACVAPMPAPPVKMPTQPKTEQALPFQNEPAQNTLPMTKPALDPWAYPDYAMEAMAQYEQNQKARADEKASALLAEQQQLVSKLMVGLPAQARPYIETYAAVEVTRVNPDEKMPAMTTAQKIAMIEHLAVGVPAEVRPAIERYIETLNTPVLTNAEKIVQIEHNAVGVPPEVQMAIQQYIKTLAP